jgi:chromosome segregation protein
MKIQKLTLQGFKSFADRTEVKLHDGITAIVGPNGCGKSNISDALRWVLGEQRSSAIRGARMEEAIFGGTSQRSPISRAEVSLTILNDDGALALPYREVVIGRTVYRGGEGEYRLNGEVVRLRDIQDLCRDTGLGATEYSVIESRMVDAILSDRAEERRALFEEAAEIGRYKDRRRTALRRLDQAQADLERLEDVIGEVGTKVRSLAQQRGRAERHREYRDRLLRLEVAVAGARLEDLTARIESRETELEEFRRRQPGEEGQLRTRETEAEALRVRIAEAERARGERARELEQVRSRIEEQERQRLVGAERAAAAERRIEAIGEELAELASRRERLESECGRLEERTAAEEAELTGLREREAELQARSETLAGDRDAARSEEEEAEERAAALGRDIRLGEAEEEAREERIAERAAELERRRSELRDLGEAAGRRAEELESARREAEGASERAAELARRHEEAEREVSARREDLRGLRERLASLEGELAAERARAAGLESLLASGGDVPAPVAALLERSDEIPGFRGLLADSLSVNAEFAPAVEAALGAYLHGLLVDGWDGVRAVRRLLVEGSEEGVLLLPLDPGPRRSTGGAKGGRGRPLVDVVRPHGAGVAWVEALLDGVRLDVDGELAARGGSWVAPDGSGEDRWGAVRLGQLAAARGTVRRRAELEEAREAAARKGTRVESLRGDVADMEARLAATAARASELAEEATDAARSSREATERAEASAARVERASRERGEASARIAELEGSLAEARTLRRKGDERLEELRAELDRASEDLAGVRERSRLARSAAEESRGRLHELQLELARRESELAGAKERLERARTATRELDERRRRLEEERAAEGEAQDASIRRQEEAGEALADLLERRAGMEARLGEAERELASRREALETLERGLREVRRSEREHAEHRHRLELELAEMRGKRGSIRERIEAEWEETLEALLERIEPVEVGGPDAWSQELEEVRRRLARLGPVNLLAAEEYEEEKERLDFLTAQRDDLVEARDDLHASIRRINTEAARAFQSTFDQVRENFQRTFASLFEGGQCDLWLEDAEDPLDSPIEISASPRGKRTQRIHLLSGGERALTALSLLFAIYLAKPSPFCIMDEVDAPLDETNIGRFVQMLARFKGDTQFIVITHNPRTIEAADWIYGVTMQEPGVSSVVGVEFGDLPEGQVA